jgi:hypothetical protein
MPGRVNTRLPGTACPITFLADRAVLFIKPADEPGSRDFIIAGRPPFIRDIDPYHAAATVTMNYPRIAPLRLPAAGATRIGRPES